MAIGMINRETTKRLKCFLFVKTRRKRANSNEISEATNRDCVISAFWDKNDAVHKTKGTKNANPSSCTKVFPLHRQNVNSKIKNETHTTVKKVN